MLATVVVGLQWGDEGKGKAIDLLARAGALVVRYQGGDNAGHTVVLGDETFKLHLVPSGVLHPDVTPVIAHGEAREPPIRPDNGLTSWAPEGVRKIGDHLRIEGDLDIPKGSRVTGNLVVAGRLRIGAGALVEGSIKAHRDIELAEGAQVSGAAVSRARLSVGPGGWIGGPAIAERGLRLSQNAVVGGPSLPATVSATEVELAPGATVYGQISAMRGARTL